MKRQRDVVTTDKQERERAVGQLGFQQGWGSRPAVLAVPPVATVNAQKQKLCRENIHGKVITQQSQKKT